jgi:hypothetical protein
MARLKACPFKAKVTRVSWRNGVYVGPHSPLRPSDFSEVLTGDSTLGKCRVPDPSFLCLGGSFA